MENEIINFSFLQFYCTGVSDLFYASFAFFGFNATV